MNRTVVRAVSPEMGSVATLVSSSAFGVAARPTYSAKRRSENGEPGWISA
jgi:hypothetical protein